MSVRVTLFTSAACWYPVGSGVMFLQLGLLPLSLLNAWLGSHNLHHSLDVRHSLQIIAWIVTSSSLSPVLPMQL